MRGGTWAGVVAVVMCGMVAVPAVGELTERVSVGSGGEQSEGWSWLGGISGDGRYVAFDSDSPLVPEDLNGTYDAFVRDRLTGMTELVGLNNAGEQGNAGSGAGPISADGRYVLFTSRSTNFFVVDGNGSGFDLFIRDRVSGTTELVGVSNTGEQPNGDYFYNLSLSADGRYVAFESDATNLVSPPTSGRRQIYLRDRVAGTTELVSVAPDGSEANYFCEQPSVSADGRYVAFYSEATNLGPDDPLDGNVSDVFVRDRLMGMAEKVSVNSLGESGNWGSMCTAISSDGRYVAFKSVATNLVPGQSQDAPREVFVRDRLAGTTEIASVNSQGVQSMGTATSVSISADGRYVAFTSDGYNLGTIGWDWHAFVRDRTARDTGWVSLSSDGEKADMGVNEARISADGCYVAFMSHASNLVPDDTNGSQDVFVRDLLGRFPDVPTFQWAYYYVEACAQESIVGGYWDGTYRPNSTVTRDQMAVFISRALAGSDALVPTAPATATFPDVPTFHWAFKYVEYCQDEGIVSGYWDGTYRPEDTVNRAQMAVYTARAMAGGDSGVPAGPETPSFTDVPADHWAYKYVEYCHEDGVVGGYWDGSYRPVESVTRAQMAVFVQRAFDLPM